MLSHFMSYNGLTFNHTLTYPCWLLDEAEGFSSPSVEHEEQRYLGLHGLDDFYSFLGGRMITLRGRVTGVSEDSMNNKLEQITLAFRLPGVPSQSATGYHQLKFWKGSDPVKFVNAKVNSLPKIEKERGIHRSRIVTIQLRCADPRIYSFIEKEVTMPKQYLLGGFPRFFPTYFPGTGEYGNQFTLTNDGNFTTPPTIVINGPCVNPRVKNVTYGYQQLFETTLLDGESITIQLVGQQIVATYDDGSDAMADEQDGSLFPWIEPGANVFEFGNTSGDGNAVITYRDAWTSAPR